MTRRTLARSAAIALGTLFTVTAAQAQTAEDQAAARSLFDEGRSLVKAGQFSTACPKFEAAANLSSSAGILLNLGDCYEKIGRTASAWTEFGESAAAADRANRREQAVEARKRQLALTSKLSRLAIHVPHAVAGMVVTRDDADVAPAAWDSAIPVDTGAHHIRAQAPGHEAWETTVTVSKPGETTTVDVPGLALSPVAPPPVVEAPPRDTPPPFIESEPAKRRPRAVGIALVAGGAAVGIGGGVLMIIEAGRASSSRSNVGTAGYAASQSEYNSTKTPYYVGLGAAVLGGVAAAAGIVWLVTPSHGSTASSAQAERVEASPWILPGGGGAAFTGRW